MLKRFLLGTVCLGCLSSFLIIPSYAQEDKIVQVAIETVRMQMRVPKGMEVKFIEKRESQIPDFYMVRLLIFTAAREIPVAVYVDKTGEKVILGALFVKGENVTRKEAGEPKPRKIDMGQLEIDKSPFRGHPEAKVTIVEFSNFLCPYCVTSWKKMKELLDKYPQDIKYVFKHFSPQRQGKAFELSEIAAATQEISNEAFWVVHDFFFSDEGQAFVNAEKGVVLQKVEEILKETSYDVKVFLNALEKGLGRKRVEEDVMVGSKIPVTGTPSTIVNGDFISGGMTDKLLERYLGK